MIISLGLGIGSLSNPQTGLMPFATSLPAMVLSGILLAGAFLGKPVDERLWPPERRAGRLKTFAVCAILVVYLLALPVLGFLAATLVLMTVLFKMNALKLWAAVLGSLVSVGLTYGLFQFVLNVPLPRSPWGF